MVAPAWCADFIGIPYEEKNCWALVRHVLKERFGVDAPEYADLSWKGHDSARSLAAAIDKAGLAWQEIWQRSGSESFPAHITRPGDVLLIRMATQPVHVGIVAETPWFLHTEESCDSALAEANDLRHDKRIVRVYRHERLGQSAASGGNSHCG